MSRPRLSQGPARHEPTRREKQIIALIASDKTSGEIATALGIEQNTVEAHRHNLMRKLELHGIAAITRYAIANDLIPTPLNLAAKGAALCAALYPVDGPGHDA